MESYVTHGIKIKVTGKEIINFLQEKGYNVENFNLISASVQATELEYDRGRLKFLDYIEFEFTKEDREKL